MFKSRLDRVECIPDETLKSAKLLLWIWYADKIPPHIGCSIDGFYFSLKAKGKDLNIPVMKVVKIIEKKAIPFLLIETDLGFSVQQIEDAYTPYFNASAEGISCLKPILDLIDNPAEVCQIKYLIEHLESTERIKHIFGVNLNQDYTGLKEYGQSEIMDRLRKLNHVKREENIS